MNCLICTQELRGPYGGYWFECSRCGFLASTLRPTIGEENSDGAIDEAYRHDALQHLRRLNCATMLDRLKDLTTTPQPTLLDIGCGYGWFLDHAARSGYKATGLEPDPAIAAKARSGGLTVIPGFFPDDLPVDASFDIITFNDVFEHLPDPRAAAEACFHHLSPSGLLAITLPSSRGLLFRVARALSALGLHKPLDRLWQRGFPSPHLGYFHPEGLSTFLGARGFRELHRGSLLTLTREGLWQRLRYDRSSAFVVSAVQYAVLWVLNPVVALLPADISFQVFQRTDR